MGFLSFCCFVHFRVPYDLILTFWISVFRLEFIRFFMSSKWAHSSSQVCVTTLNVWKSGWPCLAKQLNQAVNLINFFSLPQNWVQTTFFSSVTTFFVPPNSPLCRKEKLFLFQTEALKQVLYVSSCVKYTIVIYAHVKKTLKINGAEIGTKI